MFFTPALMCAAGLVAVAPAKKPHRVPETPPAVMREFRGAWVATVANIDWPSRPGLSTAQQKSELLAILDKAVQLHLNGIVLQVRPMCDALYPSKLEPWSEFLTGTMGRAPRPLYDPLEFAVEEAHRRGLELHAWFNPYRAHHPSGHSAISANHISRTHPELVKSYGPYLWLDPGEKAVQDYSIAVVMDVVRRYDLDGVHLDDYFYPYKEKDAAGNYIDFPDSASWNRYVASGGKLSREDWRRENVNAFIQRLYHTIKAEKKWVKFGVSPFGIWRPGSPPQIQGYDQYAMLYADARKWLNEGWVDYFSPQLYWPIAQTPQSYPVLLKWWVEQNSQGRNIWPGLYTGRVGDGSATAWKPEEIANQIEVTRAQPGATGNVHFSMKTLLRDTAGISDLLLNGVYRELALVPPSPWLSRAAPSKPRVRLTSSEGGQEARWSLRGSKRPWLWVVRTRTATGWVTRVLPGTHDSELLPATADRIVVSAVDRYGNEGPSAVSHAPSK